MLVVQADEFNQSAIRTVVCAVITSNINLAGAPGNVQLSARNSGLPKVSVVNVSQLLSVDRALLTHRVKTIDAESMRQVDDGLRLVLKL
jgi:mRNA interferase MazF